MTMTTSEALKLAINELQKQLSPNAPYNEFCDPPIEYAIEACKQALANEAPVIPDGYKLVPIEPTVKMIDSGLCGCMDNDVTVSIYKAMLEAAPLLPNEGKNDE